MPTDKTQKDSSAFILPRILMVSTFLSHKDGSHSVAEDLADRLRNEAEAIICVSSKRSGLMRSLDMVATTLQRRRDYDVAIVGLYSGRAFLWGEAVSWLLEKLGRPFVISMHGGALPNFAKQHPQRVANTLRKAAVVTAPSRFLAELMRPYRDDIVLLPNPIKLERYQFRLRETASPTLIWLRAFHQIYNPELAINVAAKLRKEFPELNLTMVGPDKGDGSRQHTEQLAKELFSSTKAHEEVTKKGKEESVFLPDPSCAFVDERVLMPGGIANSEVPAWLNRGDIFLNTTNVDNTPVSVIEAMACGLPIVSTNVGGLPYLLDDGENALLVPPNDAEAMAAAVRRVLTEPGLAERLSRNARRKAESFDWANVLPMWRELLGKIR
ncbi:MAG TPA: glycosyltransferase family 4 protein [Blastocatellia bacterium]|nr:glycosyltransferase family 4 protein [Blastocatellia bacterium]